MIETDRLTLRPYTLADYEPHWAMTSDPAVFRFLGGQALSREDTWHRVMRYAGHWSLLGYGIFAVVEKATGEYLGQTGLADFHRGLGDDFDGADEAAWAFTARSHGRGYGWEATTAAHQWYDGHRGPRRTVCMVDPENAASIGLAKKLGYRAFGERTYKEDAVVVFERQPD